MTDNNLFNLLGEEGEQYKRVEDRTPENRITDKARELIDAHNAKYPEDKDADKRVDIGKIRSSGKNSTPTSTTRTGLSSMPDTGSRYRPAR